MKVIKAGPQKTFRSVTLRLREEVMAQIDKVAEDNKISRQRLIERILEQVLGDKSFVLKV